jgi:hypothetical protein
MEKKIYTSNYARKGSDPKALAISAWPPPWYEGKGLNILAPTRQLVLDVIKGEMDLETYQKEYIKLLEERIPDPQKVLDEIPDGSFLLCYAKPSDSCHRHMMRDWFFEKTGYMIEEWKNETEQKEADQQGIVEDLLEL